MRSNHLHHIILFSIVLLIGNQIGLSDEPGYPALAGYKFYNTKIYITKIWISSDEQDPVLVESEFVIDSSKLIKKLKLEDFERPEILGDDYFNNGILYLSHQPTKGWNHGKEVDTLLIEFKRKRPKDIEKKLLHWVFSKIKHNRFRKPLISDYFNSELSYEFPISEQFKFDALMLEVNWKRYDAGQTIFNELFIVDLKF